MKAELTQENKAKFFAMYYDQCVLLQASFVKGIDLVAITCDNELTRFGETAYLELKNLSQISDDDAIEVGRMTGCWSRRELNECGDEIKDLLKDYGVLFCSGVGKEWGLRMSCPFAGNLQDIIDATDFLRSRGYALPWMGLSIDELGEAGWIRLTES